MIAFSPDIFAMQTYGGVSRCIVEIADAARCGGADCSIYAGQTSNSYALDLVGRPQWAGRLTISPREEPLGRISGSLSQEAGFSRHCREVGAQVVHRSYYRILDLLPRRIRVVETLHDMLWECFPHRLSPVERINSLLKHRALERADAIACVSAFSREEMLSRWPQYESKALVIPHGVRPLSDNPRPASFGRPYFLYVGSREFRKNFRVLVGAFGRSGLAGDCLLVCAGGGAFEEDELACFEAAGIAESVRQVGADDDALAGLYEGALALLYPSFYEGFGMPLLEAMIHGCPVLCARTSSLVEVGGTAARMLDPNDGEQWAAELVALAADGNLRAAMAETGRQNAAAYDWQSAGDAYRELYGLLA